MVTHTACCDARNCHHNINRNCTRPFITLNKEGKCDFMATQEPLLEPEK